MSRLRVWLQQLLGVEHFKIQFKKKFIGVALIEQAQAVELELESTTRGKVSLSETEHDFGRGEDRRAALSMAIGTLLRCTR